MINVLLRVVYDESNRCWGQLWKSDETGKILPRLRKPAYETVWSYSQANVEHDCQVVADQEGFKIVKLKVVYPRRDPHLDCVGPCSH